MICVKILRSATIKMGNQNIIPARIFLSPSAHDTLVYELTGKKTNKTLFEILDLPVSIDPECPAGGGYIEGIQ